MAKSKQARRRNKRMMCYSFDCRPTGILAEAATKAGLRGPIRAHSAGEARKKVVLLMRRLYPAGAWRMWLKRDERVLRGLIIELED